MRILHLRRRVGITFDGICGNRITVWARGPGRFRFCRVEAPIVLSRRSWRYAIRQLGFRRALLARGFARP